MRMGRLSHTLGSLVSLFAVTVGAAGCSGGGAEASAPGASSGNGSNGNGNGSGNGNATSATLSTKMTLARNASPQSMQVRDFIVGQNSVTGLESLKYYITSIQICESMTVQGSGFSGTNGCLQIYNHDVDSHYEYRVNPGETPSSDSLIAQANYARTTDEGFVDLMSDTSRATLNTATPLTSQHVRSYHYGIINWALPIKVKASAPAVAPGSQSATTFYTHDGVSEGANFGIVTHSSTPLTTPGTSGTGADEAVVLHPNGGTWFRFQNPLTITQADIDEHTQYVLDLAYNPDGIVKAFHDGESATNIVDDGGNTLKIPMLDLTPVPHKATETVSRESYLATVTSGGNSFDVRLELYYVTSDTTKTVYGVGTRTLANANTTASFSDFPKVTFVETHDDGTLDLQGYDRSNLVEGLTRLTQVGDSHEATLVCGTPQTGGFMFTGCSGTATVTLSLTSVSEL